MNESILLSKLLPSHPDFYPIVQAIREKYNIPEVSKSDDGITEILLSDQDIDWKSVHNDIKQQLVDNPEVLKDNFFALYTSMKLLDSNQEIEKDIANAPEIEQEKLKHQYELISKSPYYSLIKIKIEEFFNTITDILFEYLITGEVRDYNYDWFGGVMTGMIDQETPVVYAIASELSDPKEIARKFKEECTRVFGKQNINITQGQLKTADYLRMKFEGKKISDIVDEYILLHPSEFPRDHHSPAFRNAKRKKQEKIKKDMQRLQNRFFAILGDK